MPFDITNKEDRQLLTLEGAVTIRNALDLATGLAHALPGNSKFVVDTRGLEDIDTCILQILCALRKSVTGLSFDDPSEVFVSAVERCGLRREILGGREDL